MNKKIDRIYFDSLSQVVGNSYIMFTIAGSGLYLFITSVPEIGVNGTTHD